MKKNDKNVSKMGKSVVKARFTLYTMKYNSVYIISP